MAKIYYQAVPIGWRKEQKYKFLDEHGSVSNIDWTEITPDAKQNWLTAGMEKEFDGFISIGNKETKSLTGKKTEAVFSHFSNGVKTNRDSWCINFNRNPLIDQIRNTIDFYNDEVMRWQKSENKKRVRELLSAKKRLSEILDDFVRYVPERIAWTRDLKADLNRVGIIAFNSENIRPYAYRPFVLENLYFDRVLNEEIYSNDHVFPVSETENQVIALTAVGNNAPFQCLAALTLCDVHFTGDSTCFPFYIYNEDGTNRRENITDWALEQFIENYADTSITKWDIFYYTYAIMHHPEYREKYAANLKRELPRIPFAPDFWSFAKAGKELADIHVNYEEQPEYKLEMDEDTSLPLDWRVDKMKYNKDKTAIVYNDFLTIGGIPPEVHEYRLGNRSALDWIVDQYKVSIDKRSGITNDPNRDDDPQYIVRLIKKIATVSLRTNEIVNALPPLENKE